MWAYVTEFAKRGLICAVINNQKCNFEIFNSVYLENDQSCLHVFLHKSIAIQSNSLYLLYTGQQQLAAFPTILDTFLLEQLIPLALLQGGMVGGRQVATKWWEKGYVFTKNREMTSISAIFTSTCHTKQLNPWLNSSASHVVIQSAVCLPREDGAIYRPPEHSWMPDRLEKKA